MPMSFFPQMVTELQVHCGDPGGAKLSVSVCTLLLNRSYWDIIDKYKFREKETSVVFQTIPGVRRYNMPTPFEALQQLSIEDLNSFKHKVLKNITKFEYENRYINDPAGTQQKKPWAYFREGACAVLFPTPDQAYNITLKYWTVLSDLDLVGVPPIPQSWHEIILAGAIWRGFWRGGDYERMRASQAAWAEMINSQVTTESKEETDNHTAGVAVLNRDSGYLGWGGDNNSNPNIENRGF
jgi:hypothetical protein